MHTHQHTGGLEPGLLVFRPNLRRQHGYGLGAFFSRMFRHLIPFTKQYILPQAVTAAQNIANDYLEGGSIRDSLKSNAKRVLKEAVSSKRRQKGRGVSRGRKRKATTTTARSKRSPKKRRLNKKSKRKTTRKRQLRKNDFITIFDKDV